MTHPVVEIEYRLYLHAEDDPAARRVLPGSCFMGIHVSTLPTDPSRFLFARLDGLRESEEVAVEPFSVNDVSVDEAGIVGNGTKLCIGAKTYTAVVKKIERRDATLPRPEGLSIRLHGHCVAVIDQGRRLSQEDYIAHEMRHDSDQLWIVADGVGGQTRGDIASEFASHWTLWRYFQTGDSSPSVDNGAGARLGAAISEAHERLIEYSHHLHRQKKRSEPQQWVTTTLTAAALYHNRWHIAQVGNSSAYLYRPFTNEMHELTPDSHYEGDVLRYSVGHPGGCEINTWEDMAQVGDLLLLCTDGLNSRVSYGELQNMLFSAATLNDPAWDQLPARLMALAKERDVSDNVAIVLIKVFDQPQTLPTPMPDTRILHTGEASPPPLFDPRKPAIFPNLFRRR